MSTSTPAVGGRSFREASRIRKLIYLGIIVVLFAALTFTGTLVRALAGDTTPEGRDNSVARWTVSAQREQLILNELSQGKADTVGEAVRLACMLTGSRGVAVTALWVAANEKQKRHEWNEVELLVNAITTLQPRFRTPWLFQSWNLAYNVSVESDRPGDKYFYITRGIQLLADGENLNAGDPDMRYWIGFYYLNKFGVSDENNFLRCLLQLSCTDPKERDGLVQAMKERDEAARRAGASGAEADKKAADEARDRFLDTFERFVARHPQFVRRLKDMLRKNRPEDIVDFVADHRSIPSRFADDIDPAEAARKQYTDLRTDAENRFPILPTPAFDPTNREYLNDDPAAREETAGAIRQIDDSFDNYMAARSWMTYAQLPLPPLPKVDGKGIPSRTPKPSTLKRGERIPKSPMLVIFRQYPARSQAYVGERLIKEGWFDREGWILEDATTPTSERWFPGTGVRQYGAGRDWCESAWRETLAAWTLYGSENGLELDPATRERMEALAREYRKESGTGDSDISREPLRDEFPPGAVGDELYAGSQTHLQLVYLSQNLHVTNFAHFKRRAVLESNPDTVQARKLLAKADRLRGNQARAIEAWQQGFDLWRKVLRADDPLLAGDERQRIIDTLKDSTLMEDLFERYLRFKSMMEEARVGRPENDGKPEADLGRRPEGAAELAGMLLTGPTGPAALGPRVVFDRTFYLPLEGTHPATGLPWFGEDIMTAVRNRLKTPGKPDPGAPPPTPPGPPGQPVPPPG